MECKYQQICGGCPLRNLSTAEYQNGKTAHFNSLLAVIKQKDIPQGRPFFIADGTRRRAEFTFRCHKGTVAFGFNQRQSHEIADIENCLLLTPKINSVLKATKNFVTDLCHIKTGTPNKGKSKNKKNASSQLTSGDVLLTETDNGLDILLTIDTKIELEQRLLICEFANSSPHIIRISARCPNGAPETIIAKSRPYVTIGNQRVFIPGGMFLQASSAGEQALTQTVLRYIDNTEGSIADLFCGVGTFSYPLAANPRNKITALDSSAELLDGFLQTVNAGMIHNIEISKRNLFKYPLDCDELKKFDVVIFDPPRAGAAAQVAKLSALPVAERPQKIIAVSCNPHTFINDANMLIAGGYTIKEITLVDQFVYANHFELVALFM